LWHVFHSKEKLPSETFPTKRVECVLNEENFLQQTAAGVVAKELINIWIFCNVYPVNEITVKQKNCCAYENFQFNRSL